MATINVSYKSFVRSVNRKTGEVTVSTIVTNKADEADLAKLAMPTPVDYTKASDSVKEDLKVRFLKQATEHASKAGKCIYLRPETFYISPRTLSVDSYAVERKVLAEVDFAFPDVK